MLRGRFRSQLHFSPDRQADFIQRHGSWVSVWPCLNCPCLGDHGQPDPLCPVCKDTGRFYPVDAHYTMPLLPYHEASKPTDNEAGWWTQGVLYATLLPGTSLARNDKIIYVDVKDTYSDEVLIRGFDDTLRFTHGVELELVATREMTYRAGQDYRLQSPNTIQWVPGGNAPAFNKKYSCRYRANPEYLMWGDSPRLRVEHRRGQAPEVMLMRADKIGDVP